MTGTLTVGSLKKENPGGERLCYFKNLNFTLYFYRGAIEGIKTRGDLFL